jgi:hypothetical protein
MKMIQILKKHWYILVILLLVFLLWYNFKNRYRLIENIEVERSQVIKDLRDSVNLLVDKNIKVQAKYDEQQTLLIQNITTENEKIITKIVNIPRYSDKQRDSLWATTPYAQEDSIPRGYWDILNKKTGGRSIKELGVQGVLQNKP